MDEMRVIITVADNFEPDRLLDRFAETSTRVDETSFEVLFPTALHGLAFTRQTSPDQVLTVANLHPVDADGWADWRQSGPGETEMSERLLPQLGPAPGTMTAFRYDDAWVWDPSRPSAAPSLLTELGLDDASGVIRDAAGGRGGWAWKAIKFAWNKSPILGDPRIQAALWLTERGWEKLKQQSYDQRARMDKLEFERRLIIDLSDIRRQRLDTGSESSRRKARQHYAALDALIAANR